MKVSVFSFLLLVISMNVRAENLPITPQENFFSMAVWKHRNVVTIPREGVRLSEAAYISADEVILEGPLVTQGHGLILDTLRLTFRAEGKIVAFDAPAAEGPVGPEGNPAYPSKQTAGTGSQGENGFVGGAGQDGHADPAAIVVHAVETVGAPIIDGKGQQGGRGGQGGKGGRGGQGGKGSGGNASCGGQDTQAGRGGKGGMGGLGGQGGIGGKGGRPVPIVFVTGNQRNLSLHNLVTQSGAGGEPGLPGLPGDPGAGGPGGNGDNKSCAFGTDPENVNPGPPGFIGDPQTATLGHGTAGVLGDSINLNNLHLKRFLDLQPEQPRPIVYSFDNLSQARVDMLKPWLQFHWARNFLILIYETMAEVQSSNLSPNLEASSSSIMAQMLLNVNNERLETLKTLWQEQFVQPLEAQSNLDSSISFKDSLEIAKNVVSLLQNLEAANTNEDTLNTLLRQVLNGAETQFQGSLQNALFSCAGYTQLLRTTDRRAVELSPYYVVPVCNGEPDFRQKSNISKSIELFGSWQQHVSPDLSNYVQTIAHQRSFPQRVLSWILPTAWAEAYDFEILEDPQLEFSHDMLGQSLPSKSLLVAGYGRVVGYVAPEKNLTANQIKIELRNLSAALNEMRKEQGQ